MVLHKFLLIMIKIGLERKPNYKLDLFEKVEYPEVTPHNHIDIRDRLLSVSPYTISVLVESLDYRLRKRSEYVKYIYQKKLTIYKESIFKEFFKDFGFDGGDKIYSSWLKKYKNDDEGIFKNELETRYKKEVLEKRDANKLFKERRGLTFERYYNLPVPLNHIDWRNPFDNIFV